MRHQLLANDKAIITTTQNEAHYAVILEIGQHDIYINLSGFGKITIKWCDIQYIHKLIESTKRGDSYGPSYRTLVWDRESAQLQAS